MPKPPKIHYTDSPYTACGMIGQDATATQIAAEVTCKACRRSTRFKAKYPELAIGPTGGGRKPMQEVVERTFHLRLPHELNYWLNKQGNMAGTIVKALEMMRKRN